jgi:hypothetical protein
LSKEEKKESIDFSRKVIYVKHGKGRKDRYTHVAKRSVLTIKNPLDTLF